jgi:dihydrodipicolinate synthase/N-acetylneuraminate lyase
MDYYHALVQAAGIPVILYYMPQPGVSFTLANVLESLSIPGVTGVKSSTNDFFFTQQLMNEKPAGCVVFNGKDEYLAPAVIHGANRGIGMWASVFPNAYAGIFHAAKAGEYEKAFGMQKTLTRSAPSDAPGTYAELRVHFKELGMPNAYSARGAAIRSGVRERFSPKRGRCSKNCGRSG